MSALTGLLENNPYFGAGFGLMGVGLGATALRKGAQVWLFVEGGWMGKGRLILLLKLPEN